MTGLDPRAELARVRTALAALIHDADDQLNDDRDRQLILEHLLDDLDDLAASIPTNTSTTDAEGTNPE